MSEIQAPNKDKTMTRRQFIRRTGSVAAAMTVAGTATKRFTGKALGANERIGIGFIGCGGRSQAHLQTVHYLKNNGANVDIVAACDVYRPRMQRVAEGYKAKGYTDYRELLEDPHVDVVCIATPDHHHGYQAIDAIKAGKDVYCEKPVTHWRQFDLTKRLARQVAESDRVFQLGTQGMSDGAWKQMRDLVKDGLIGRPVHAECGYFRVGDWGERGMPIDDKNAKPGSELNWEAFLGESPKRAFDVSRFFRWRMYKDYAGGPSTDLYPHSLTPVVSILGVGMPRMAVATGGKFRYEERDVPDTFNMLIDYPEKITVAVLGTQANDNPGLSGRGSGGRIPVIRGWDGTLTVEGNNIVFTPAQGSTKKAERFAIEHGEDFVGYWRKFLDCCRDREKETLSTMDLAYRVQTALQMAMWGFVESEVAKFDADLEKIVL
jgi:predicted dehydrogenase